MSHPFALLVTSMSRPFVNFLTINISTNVYINVRSVVFGVANHSQHRPTSRPQAYVTTYDTANFDIPIPHTPVPAPSPSVEPNSDPDMQQMFNKFMQSMITSHMDKVEGHPQASAHISGPDPTHAQALDQELGKTYGLPAVALPNHLSLSKLHLGKTNILWTHITSAGVPLPLPLDTCCSLSPVSKAHADIVCQKYPSAQFLQSHSLVPLVFYKCLLCGKLENLVHFPC